MERLVLQQVQKRFGPRVEILQGVSYTFEAGRFYGIIGASGAGKTTLLQIMGTLEEPTGGRVVINGRDSGEMSVQERAKLRNEQIGFVFQSFFHGVHRTAAHFAFCINFTIFDGQHTFTEFGAQTEGCGNPHPYQSSGTTGNHGCGNTDDISGTDGGCQCGCQCGKR